MQDYRSSCTWVSFKPHLGCQGEKLNRGSLKIRDFAKPADLVKGILLAHIIWDGRVGGTACYCFKAHLLLPMDTAWALASVQIGKFQCWDKGDEGPHTGRNGAEGSGVERRHLLQSQCPYALPREAGFEREGFTPKQTSKKVLFSCTATNPSGRSPHRFSQAVHGVFMCLSVVLKPLGDWLALSLSGSLATSAASCGLAIIYSPRPPFKGKIFGRLVCWSCFSVCSI